MSIEGLGVGVSGVEVTPSRQLVAVVAFAAPVIVRGVAVVWVVVRIVQQQSDATAVAGILVIILPELASSQVVFRIGHTGCRAVSQVYTAAQGIRSCGVLVLSTLVWLTAFSQIVTFVEKGISKAHFVGLLLPAGFWMYSGFGVHSSELRV